MIFNLVTVTMKFSGIYCKRSTITLDPFCLSSKNQKNARRSFGCWTRTFISGFLLTHTRNQTKVPKSKDTEKTADGLTIKGFKYLAIYLYWCLKRIYDLVINVQDEAFCVFLKIIWRKQQKKSCTNYHEDNASIFSWKKSFPIKLLMFRTMEIRAIYVCWHIHVYIDRQRRWYIIEW